MRPKHKKSSLDTKAGFLFYYFYYICCMKKYNRGSWEQALLGLLIMACIALYFGVYWLIFGKFPNK
jgi:hypothetical protein